MSPEDEIRLLKSVETAIRNPDSDLVPTTEEGKTAWSGFVAILVWSFAVGAASFVIGAAWRGSQIVGG